jgi:hypothetical protein
MIKVKVSENFVNDLDLGKIQTGLSYRLLWLKMNFLK